MECTLAKPRRRDIHIVGSVPLAGAEEVFRAIGAALGSRVQRIPDGETGARLNWIEWQAPVFDRHPMFERRDEHQTEKTDWRIRDVDRAWRLKGWHSLRPGASASEVSFGPLGYAEAAIASYRIFSRLKREGVIHPACRFQVSLPTPYNVLDQRLPPEQRLAIEPAYEKRMLAEVEEMAGAIPHGELAIQWDDAHEIENLDGARAHWPEENPEEAILARMTRLGDHVPAGIELGHHFCYGDFGHKHIIEPRDMELMVRIANRLSRATGRPIQWIHMPVPRDRSDEAYFAPLEALELGPQTRLYLGLVHYTDGLPGALKRLEAARRFVEDFGIATECGMGRRPPETIAPLLELHARVSDAKAGIA